MTYQSVLTDLFYRLPFVEDRYRESFAYVEGEAPLPYLVFGAVLVPTLEQALAAGDLAKILKIAAFLEEASEDAGGDIALGTLLRSEIGDWLKRLEHEDRLAMWLGPETKRVCGYVPGLATQRNRWAEEWNEAGPVQRLKMRLGDLLRRGGH